jgi:hypothetical protein
MMRGSPTSATKTILLKNLNLAQARREEEKTFFPEINMP